MIIRFDYEKLICDIESFRKENKLTKRDFANLAGLNVAIVSRVVNRDYTPGYKSVKRIAAAMGKTVDDYSIEPKRVLSVNKNYTYDNMSIERLNKLIAELVEIRNEKIRLEIEKLELQKKEINESITEYNNQLMNKD